MLLASHAGVIFRGGDDAPYEVRGEAGVSFNIISSPRLSVNAGFATVPSTFPTLAVGDTVMADLGIALCGADGGQALQLHIDSATGDISLANETIDGDGLSGHGRPLASVWQAALATGALLSVERFVCHLEHMNCTWTDVVHAHAGGTAGTRPPLPLVDSGHSRMKLSSATRQHGGGSAPPPDEEPDHDPVSLAVARNALVAPDTDVDCVDFADWAAASDACLSLLNGTAPAERREEWALLLTMPYMLPHQRFHFSQVDVPTAVSSAKRRKELQRRVHGLLGQRAHAPLTAEQVRAANRRHSSRAARGLVRPYFGDGAEGGGEDGGDGSGGSGGGGGGVGGGDDLEGVGVSGGGDDLEGVGVSGGGDGPEVRWSGSGGAAGALGRSARLAAEKFGMQGEGAIEGSVRHYRVSSLHSHDFRYSRFNCSDGPAPTASRGPAGATTRVGVSSEGGVGATRT